MKNLNLNLKKIYFDEIKNGTKEFEYRLVTPYWKKRLENKEYDQIIIKCGYPKKGDLDKEVIRLWKGYEIQKLRHIHFGENEVEVFAIKVN